MHHHRFLLSLRAALVLGAFVVPAWAAESPVKQLAEAVERLAPEAWLAGRWEGSYVCDQGLTRLQLEIHPLREAGVEAVFSFAPHPSNPRVPTGRFVMRGALLEGTNTLELRGVQWIDQPPDYGMVDLRGEVSMDHTRFSGAVVNGYRCTGFTLKRSETTPPPVDGTRQ